MYYMNNFNRMNHIHDNKVNNIAECNLLHVIFNSSKHTKSLNSHYYLILRGCMNKRRGKAKSNIFLIFFDSGFSYTFLFRKLMIKLKTKEYYVIQ